ncbi:MAG: hypothetical protein QOG73_4 [Acetobacteraceae bacterium]|jgi:hypothetical protein|nr:hypothetical protein [Acetobacteraceae bacterium]
MDRLSSFNRVSLRAVLVTNGQDPSVALAAAGIFDPIAVTVVLGDGPTISGAVLGDVVTPNLTGVLEPDQEHDWGPLPALQPNRTSTASISRQSGRKVAATSLEPLGRRSFAPITSRSGV